jgi:hypothetical protein
MKKLLKAFTIGTVMLGAAVPGTAFASTKNDGPHQDYQITINYTGSTVNDDYSRIGCVTNSYGHHDWKVNNQVTASAANGTIYGGSVSVGLWHPNRTYVSGTKFSNSWSWVSGCTPQGSAQVTL